jgi:predicted AAA+ superfamily ATPase
MRKEELIAILSEWNFWGKGLEVGIERITYTNKIKEFLNSPINKIISVYGVRRSGKSFILRQIAKFLSENFGPKNSLYINFEDIRLEKNLETLLKCYEAYLEIIRPTSKPFLLLDEIQEVDGGKDLLEVYKKKMKLK